MYQLRFRNKVVGSKPGVNDQYRRIESLIQSFTFNLSQPMFVGKESGVFKRLVDFEAIQRVNHLQGCNDFNGVVISLDTTKFIITVLFDLNAWYFAQMPGTPNQVARLSPYISYLPLEKSSMPSYCCLQAVKVKAQSLFRGKLSSSEACNVFPCSLNTIVRYHIGKNIVNAFYFPTNELVLDPGNSVQGLADLALKGIFTKHNTLVQSKKGRQKVFEFLTTFLPDLKIALNNAMSPMLSGLPTGDTELKKLRELLSVSSHCIYLGNKLRKGLPEKYSYHVLYQHTYQYAKTVLALTDVRVLPSSHASLQDFGCRMLPLRFTAIGELLDNISGLSDLWEDDMFPPKTIRSLLNVFYTKPLDTTLQGYVVAYSVLYLNKDNLDIRDLNTLSGEDADAISSIFHLDKKDYNKFIKYLPSKSGVFKYCSINSICDILLQQKKRDVAKQMLMVLDESYASLYSPRTMSLLADMLSSEYKINLISNGATDLLAFSTVLDEQLSHKQFSSLLKSLDNQERFDCLFYLILKKNKLCDLLSAYGETKHSQKSSSQFLEFMFLYTIKHFSDIELKASITACQGNSDSKGGFNKSIPLSAQKCQNDISVLSKFCLKTDLGNFKLGNSPKTKKCTLDSYVVRTPPPQILDISDELLLQLRTPHPTPLKQKILTALEAPRSILRSSKTERKNRKRIRFDNPSDALPESKPIRLSFGGVEFSEPSSSSSPTKKLTFDEDMTLHKGVSLADISPPKPVIESVVQYDDIIGDDKQIPVLQDLSNDSVSFEIFGSSTEPENISMIPSEVSVKLLEEVSEVSEITELSYNLPNPSSLPGISQDQLIDQIPDDSLVELSIEESFVSAASAERLINSQLFDQSLRSILPQRDVLVNSSVEDSVPEPMTISFGDSSSEERATIPALPDSPSEERSTIPASHNSPPEEIADADWKEPNVLSLDSSNEILEIESTDGEEGVSDGEEGVSDGEDGVSDGDEQVCVIAPGYIQEVAHDKVGGKEEKNMVGQEHIDNVHSVHCAGSVQVIGIDSSHSDIEDEQKGLTSSTPVNERSEVLQAGSAAETGSINYAQQTEQSGGSGSFLEVIGIDSHSESSNDESEDSGSESGGESHSSDNRDSSEHAPDAIANNKNGLEEDQESEDEVEEAAGKESESDSESSGPIVLEEKGSPAKANISSSTETDTQSSAESVNEDEVEFLRETLDEETENNEHNTEPSIPTIPGYEVSGGEIHFLRGNEDPTINTSSAIEQVVGEDCENSEEEILNEDIEMVMPIGQDSESGLSIPTVREHKTHDDDVHAILEEDDQSTNILAAIDHGSNEHESDVNVSDYIVQETESVVMVVDNSEIPGESGDLEDNVPPSSTKQVSEDEIHAIPDDNSSRGDSSESGDDFLDAENYSDLASDRSEYKYTADEALSETEHYGITSLLHDEDSMSGASEGFQVTVLNDAEIANPSESSVICIDRSDRSDHKAEFDEQDIKQALKEREHASPLNSPSLKFASSQENDSFFSVSTEAISEDVEAGPSDIGNILESDESDDEEEFAFEAPEQVVPQSTWFMETFPDHDKLSFDFNAPQRAAPSTHRVTRSKAKKPKAIGTDDILSPPAPLINPPSMSTDSAVFTVLSPVCDQPSLLSEDLSLSTIESAFSPQQIETTPRLEQSKCQAPEISFLTSPEKPCPKYQLSKTQDGTLKLKNVNPGLAAEAIDLFGDTQSSEGSELQSFVDDYFDKKVGNQSALPMKARFDSINGDSSFKSIIIEASKEDFTPPIEHIESDHTEPLPLPGPNQDSECLSEPELVYVPSEKVGHTEALSLADDVVYDLALISEPNIITISEAAISESLKRPEEEVPPTSNLRSSYNFKDIDSASPPSSQLEETQLTVSAEPTSATAEKRPYKILRAPKMLSPQDAIDESTSSATEKKPHKIHITEETPVPNRRNLRSRKIEKEKLKSSVKSSSESSVTILKLSSTAKTSPQIMKRALRSRRDKTESISSPTLSLTDVPHNSSQKPASPASESRSTTKRIQQSKADKIEQVYCPKPSSLPSEESPQSTHNLASPALDSPPTTRRALRSKTDRTESSPKQSTRPSEAMQNYCPQKPASQAPESPLAQKRTLRSEAILAESHPGKGMLRPRQHTTSDSNSDEKPANKMRKSPREGWVMPVSPNKTNPPLPPITVTRSSRRLRKQVTSSEIAAEPSCHPAVPSETTPVRVKRGNGRNKQTTAAKSGYAIETETPVLRLTRRRKNPSELEVSSSRSSSRQSSNPEESMQAKKPRATQQSRNTPVRAASSTVNLTERRETRSTRKGSGK